MPALILAALAIGRSQEPQLAFQSYDLPVGLTISMPAKPEAMKPEKGENRQAFVSYGDDAVYFVSDAPVGKDEQKDLTPDQQIAAYICSSLASSKDRHLVRYSDILWDGWPGVEFALEDRESGDTVCSRCYAMNNQLVEVGAIYASGGMPPPGLASFFASFKQTRAPKYGPCSSIEFQFTHLEPDGVPFSLDFPGEAKDNPVELGKDDTKSVLHMFEYERDMRTFHFSYLDLPNGAEASMPDDGPEQLRNVTLDSIIDYYGGTKDSSTTEVRDGNDWLTAQFNIKGVGYGRADVMYFKGRVYSLVAIGPECWDESPEYRKFFDSFEVKN